MVPTGRDPRLLTLTLSDHASIVICTVSGPNPVKFKYYMGSLDSRIFQMCMPPSRPPFAVSHDR